MGSTLDRHTPVMVSLKICKPQISREVYRIEISTFANKIDTSDI